FAEDRLVEAEKIAIEARQDLLRNLGPHHPAMKSATETLICDLGKRGQTRFGGSAEISAWPVSAACSCFLSTSFFRRLRRRRASIRLPQLTLDSISEKTFLADSAHIDQRTMHACGQKFVAQTGQRRCLASAKHVRRDREIELIDQVLFQ